jgi:glycosyltransferase involved in cell wall biosynthesis
VKMKIAQVIQSNSWGEISPEAFERGIGGREGAFVRLAKEWARLGHEVTNFVHTNKAKRFDEHIPSRAIEGKWYFETNGFHEYIPISLAQPMLASFPYDAVVAWECPSVFGMEEIQEKQPVRLVHMQVAHLSDEEMVAANEFATGLVALSEWAKNFLVHSGLTQPNLHVRPNGVNIADYPVNLMKKGKGAPKFVYSSSPDRGLLHLLKMWPLIRSEHKKAILYVAYGVNSYTEKVKWSHNRQGEMCVEIEELMKQPGVVDVGKIGQKTLADLQMKSTAWLYPADTIQATETGCITAIENMAAGNICLVSDADCLEDEFGHGFVGGKGKISEYPPPAIVCPLPFDQQAWANGVTRILKNQEEWLVRRLAARTFAETRDWGLIAPTWIDLFKENNV